MTGLRSGQVAEAAGVNLQTLRYYERRGLLAEPDRTLGGHRLYPVETVTVLRVIKAAQRLGFSLQLRRKVLACCKLGDVMTRIAVIITSTRQERFADRPAAWVTERLRREGLDIRCD